MSKVRSATSPSPYRSTRRIPRPSPPEGYSPTAKFSFRATLGHGRAHLDGSIDGHAIELRIEGAGRVGGPTLITGSYQGPPALLLILVGAVPFFA